MAQINSEDTLSFSDSSWQQKVFLASQYVMSSNNDYSSPSDSFFYDHMDNTSNGCATWLDEYSTDCSCEPRMLLRWARILFYKVARTYMAAPLLLAFLPLCIGLVVGLWVGTRWERAKDKKNYISDFLSGTSAWNFSVVNSLCKYMPFAQGEDLVVKENQVRADLLSDTNAARESGVDLKSVPKHVAVIMDGNRRYGKARYGNVAKVCYNE